MSDVRAETIRFGELLGRASGGVAAYSSDYASVDEREYPDRHAYRSYVDGVYMGQKWQCVEFARRWLFRNRGLLFDEVGMAYEIFDLTTIRDVRNGRILPLRAFRNGARRPPEPGCLLVWDEGGEFDRTGHVAVVEEVLPDRVRFAEQNFDHHRWPAGRPWAREIHATRTPTGEFWLESSFTDATILGWVIQTGDDVLRDDALLARFGLPRSLWPKIRRSWNDRRNELITGRMDFAMTSAGLKVYECNCDSAACYMECGKVQGRWAEHYGCDVGEEAGAGIHERLRQTWRRTGIDGLVHVLHDDDPE